MTHSFRHTPIMGIAGDSDRWYKKTIHGQERVRLREALAHGEYDLAEIELAKFDSWASMKDGKRYMPSYDKVWRK